MTISQRERNVIIWGWVLLLSILFYHFVVSPILDDHSRLSVDLPSKEMELHETRELAMQYDSLLEEREKLQLQVNSDRKRMFRRESLVKAQNALIEHLNRCADQAKILVVSQDPLPVEQMDVYSHVQIRFDVEGSSISFREFLKAIEDSDILLGVKKLRLASSRDRKKLEISMEIAALASETDGDDDLPRISTMTSMKPMGDPGPREPRRDLPRILDLSEQAKTPRDRQEKRFLPQGVDTDLKERAAELRKRPPFIQAAPTMPPGQEGKRPIVPLLPGVPYDPRLDEVGPEYVPMLVDEIEREYLQK